MAVELTRQKRFNLVSADDDDRRPTDRVFKAVACIHNGGKLNTVAKAGNVNFVCFGGCLARSAKDDRYNAQRQNKRQR